MLACLTALRQFGALSTCQGSAKLGQMQVFEPAQTPGLVGSLMGRDEPRQGCWVGIGHKILRAADHSSPDGPD